MTPLRCSSSTPASAARAFVQLSCARRATTTSSSLILDVLLPRSWPPPLLPVVATRSFHRGSNNATGPRKGGIRCRPASPPTPLVVPTRPRRSSAHVISNSRDYGLLGSSIIPSSPSPSPPPRRHHSALFSTTAAVRRTQVIYNPQQDDDGSDMLMEITPRAANRLSKIMAQDKNPDLALRIQVESGGCHGFQYLMSLTTLPPLPPSSSSTPTPPPASSEVAAEVTPSTTTSATPAAPELREDDTVFAFVKEGEAEAEPQSDVATTAAAAAAAAAPKIVLDGPSLQLLRGSKVDYTMELIGSQFKITDNPHATSSCGCGTSFDIKDL